MGRTAQATKRGEVGHTGIDRLAALPGAVVTRNVSGDILAVTFRGDFAGQQDMTLDEADELIEASNAQRVTRLDSHV